MTIPVANTMITPQRMMVKSSFLKPNFNRVVPFGERILRWYSPKPIVSENWIKYPRKVPNPGDTLPIFCRIPTIIDPSTVATINTPNRVSRSPHDGYPCLSSALRNAFSVCIFVSV